MDTIQEKKLTRAVKEHRCNFYSGTIEKGQNYFLSVYKDDDIYAWKIHLHCSEIALKLKMYDVCDNCVGIEEFTESINIEYQLIMSETQKEIYESKDFVEHKFEEQLDIVMN